MQCLESREGRSPRIAPSTAACLRAIRPGPIPRTKSSGRKHMADLIETKQDGVAILTMNRPEAKNALSTAMLDGLLEALPRLAQDPSIGAVIITGAGGAFCAGGDVKGFARKRRRREPWPHAGRSLLRPAPAHGSVALAARHAEDHHCRHPRRSSRRRPFHRARLRLPHRRPRSEDHDGVRESRPLRRLRRHVFPHAACRRREGEGTLPAFRRDPRRGGRAARRRQPRCRSQGVAGRSDDPWPDVLPTVPALRSASSRRT